MDRLADPLLPGGQLKQATDFREAGRTTVGESHKPIGTIWAPGLEPGTLGLENQPYPAYLLRLRAAERFAERLRAFAAF